MTKKGTKKGTAAKKRKSGKRTALNGRQKKLVALMPKVELGEMTLEDAMLQAGYSEKTAKQQSATVNRIRNNSVMQDALRKSGVTEEFLADKISRGVKANRGHVQRSYVELGVKLLDGFPSEKHEHEIITPIGYDEIQKRAAHASSPAEAKKKAGDEEW